MSSDIVILDDVFDKDSFPNIQSDLISKIKKYRSSTFDIENWCLLKTEHQFKHFCLKLINIAADHFDLASCGGYEFWWHENTKPPTWHIDCDEKRKREDNCMLFPLCSIVYYIKVDDLVGGKLHISNNDDVKSGDTSEKFHRLEAIHDLNHKISSLNQGSLTLSQGDTSIQTNNLNNTIIDAKTNRIVMFPAGKFHMVEDFTGTRISMVVNPWDISNYKYSQVNKSFGAWQSKDEGVTRDYQEAQLWPSMHDN